MKKILLIISVVSLGVFTSCNDFLSESKSKSTNDPIERIEQLDVLLNKVTRGHNAPMTYCSDDTEITTELYDGKDNGFTIANLVHYIYDMDAIENLAEDGLNSELWGRVLEANTIINNVDKVTGSDEQKAKVKAEAYFIRAFFMWELANYYCMPYHADNLDGLGISLRKGTNMVEDIARSTLRQTYEQIDADLEEALKIAVTQVAYKWRPAKASINAFLSRYYLHRCEYGKVITAADFALTNAGTTELKDYNTLNAGTPTNYTNPSATIAWSEFNDYAASQYYSWQEFFFVRFGYGSSNWNVPSESLRNMYTAGANDMRYKWFFHDNANRKYNVKVPNAYFYSHFNDGYLTMSGPTVQEVMLNKAEALVRKSSPDITGAMQIINDLRANRIATGTPGLVVSATNAADALKIVLDERRRELPFAHRFWDIRRFAYNETPADDVTVSHTFYAIKNSQVDKSRTETYTLPPKSKKYAMPLNGLDIDASDGQVKQNSYD